MSLYGRLDSVAHPVANILITHGYAEHLGRYDQLTKRLNKAGLNVYRYDQNGHGLSSGRRATVDANDLVRQHYRVRQQIRHSSPDLPLFVLGHSMGGLVTAASVLVKPSGVAGVVLSGPALAPNQNVPGPLADTLYEIGRLLPTINTITVDPDKISRDPQVVNAYQSDDLNYTGSMPLLTSSSIAALGQRLWSHVREWKPNCLIIQGAKDEVVSLEATRLFAQEAGKNAAVPPTIDYVEVPDARHEVLNEPEGPFLNALVAQWVKNQL